MGLQKLWWDFWNGPVYDEHEIEAPEWPHVEMAVRGLDADQRTIVRLIGKNDVELLIGGGSGRFIITAVIDDDKHVSARAAGPSGEDIELTVGGQTGVYSSQIVWDLDTALRASRVFWRDNVLDPELPWSGP
jgi:hypothetical protein